MRSQTSARASAGRAASAPAAAELGAVSRGERLPGSKQLGGQGRHKLKLKQLQRGKSYELALSVTSADGQQAADSAKLKVKK